MWDFFANLFNTTGFPARWHCGIWTSGHGWLHILSDIAVFGAYVAIPCVLGFFVLRKRDVPFPRIFWLFGAFIFACGFGHLLEAIIFWQPVYRFAGLIKFITAVVSWGTVIALVQIVPQALHLPGLAKLNTELRNEVDERRRVENALRQSEEKLAQLLASEREARGEAERANSLKDDFISSVSHELRTPLNAILGYAQLLLRENSSDGDYHDGLAVIERNAKVQAHIIEDLLDMSSILSGKVRLDAKTMDLNQIVNAAIATVRPAADAKSIRIETDLCPGAAVWGDADRLQQVVWNLLSNAIKFTPTNGRVTVSLARGDSHVELRIADTGQGIRPEFLPFVFDRFRQADSSTTRRYGGLGLGLSIVKNLVELHGGKVEVHSDGEGQGATFVVKLPAQSARADGYALSDGDGRASDSVNTDYLSLKGVRVLVVDDDRDAADLMRRLLAEHGAQTDIATSADTALELIRENPPDMLLSDIGMPEKDGYELIRAVRAAAPHPCARVPAAAITALARPQDRTRAMLAGFQAHLTKPFDPSELLAVVASLTGRTGRPAETSRTNGASDR